MELQQLLPAEVLAPTPIPGLPPEERVLPLRAYAREPIPVSYTMQTIALPLKWIRSKLLQYSTLIRTPLLQVAIAAVMEQRKLLLRVGSQLTVIPGLRIRLRPRPLPDYAPGPTPAM